MFQEKAMHCREKKRSKTIVFLLAVDVCICVCVLLAAWAVFLKEPQAAALEPESAAAEVALAPDIAPSEVEPNQTPIGSSTENENEETGEPDGSAGEPSADSNAKKVGGGGADISFTKDVSISLANQMVSLSFGNGESSTVDIVVQVVVQEQVLAQSGKLTPGNKIKQLALVEGVATLLKAGDYDGAIRFYCYDGETGEKTYIASNIPVAVTVQN